MSRRLYRFLLLMLPGWFREEFGREMTQAFVDCARIAAGATRRRRDGTGASACTSISCGRICVYALRTLRQSADVHAHRGRHAGARPGPDDWRSPVSCQRIVLLDPLPGFNEPDRLVRFWHARLERNRREFPLSDLELPRSSRAKQDVFERSPRTPEPASR